MNFFAKTLSLILALCLLFSFAGCNATINNESDTKTSNETSSISGGHRVEPSENEDFRYNANTETSSNEAPFFPGGESAIENTTDVPQTKNGRTLVWHDEFTASTLDSNKWHFSRTMGADDRIYTNDSTHAHAENGNFILQAYRSESNPKRFSLPEGLNTKYTMNFKYGYLEMRAKIPMRQGAWPSFWMLSDTVFKKAAWKSEIDIFECFGSDTQLDICLHKHGGSLGSGSLPKSTNFYSGSRSFSFASGMGNEVYHVFGLEWEPSFLKFSIDGNVYATVPIDGVTVASWGDPIKNADGYHDFHYIIMNNELLTDGGWYKHSSESRVKDHTVFPFTYSIDYVRLYQKAGEELKIKADIDAAR